jgi:hypothetical protein
MYLYVRFQTRRNCRFAIILGKMPQVYSMHAMDRLFAHFEKQHTLPSNDATFIQECLDVWTCAHAALIKRLDGWTQARCVQFFKAFCTWRLRASRALITPHATECGFIVTCALRLILMDSLSDLFPTAFQLANFGDLLKDWTHPLKDAELAHLVCYDHPEDSLTIEAELNANVLKWSSQLADDGCHERLCFWSKCAAVVAFSPTAEVPVNAGAIKLFAFYDDQAAKRSELLFLLHSKEQPAPDVEALVAHSATRWAKHSTQNVGDELYALGKECCLLLSMTPYALVMAQKDGKPPTNYAKVLSDWLNPVALDAQRLASRGFAVLQDDTVSNADPRKSVCFLNLFDYGMRQLYDVQFMNLFFAHDITPAAALTKITAYTKDNIVNPAPMLLLSLNNWWLLYRSKQPGRLEKTERYDSCLDAVCAWLFFVRDERRSTLFLGKNIHAMIHEVIDNTTDDALDRLLLPATVVNE